ncbi:MAG: hypothetical protein ACTHXA_12835 [Gulosibacter sp.]
MASIGKCRIIAHDAIRLPHGHVSRTRGYVYAASRAQIRFERALGTNGLHRVFATAFVLGAAKPSLDAIQVEWLPLAVTLAASSARVLSAGLIGTTHR